MLGFWPGVPGVCEASPDFDPGDLACGDCVEPEGLEDGEPLLPAVDEVDDGELLGCEVGLELLLTDLQAFSDKHASSDAVR
jgi:hypothetical protein